MAMAAAGLDLGDHDEQRPHLLRAGQRPQLGQPRRQRRLGRLPAPARRTIHLGSKGDLTSCDETEILKQLPNLKLYKYRNLRML